MPWYSYFNIEGNNIDISYYYTAERTKDYETRLDKDESLDKNNTIKYELNRINTIQLKLDQLKDLSYFKQKSHFFIANKSAIDQLLDKASDKSKDNNVFILSIQFPVLILTLQEI